MAKTVFLILAILGLATLYAGVTHFQKPQPQPLGDLECGLTPHFNKWLKTNGYADYNFNAPHDIKCAAYGGKMGDTDKIKKAPVIFIHGNSDIGFGRGSYDGYVDWQTGFRSLAQYLTTQGYSQTELYTTTWGIANASAVYNVFHSKDNVMFMRKFVEAVLEYTGAKKIHVITHSMGVTLGRRVIKGGLTEDRNGAYNVGPALTKKVGSFIGLAGANLGLTACLGNTLPTCSVIDGFSPGLTALSGPSTFMKELNSDGVLEGSKVYTIWGQYDTTIGVGGLVWGKVTCRINGQIGEIKQTSPSYDHFAIRDKTGPELIKWLD